MSQFKILTTDELIKMCQDMRWTRKPKEMQIHHTWVPAHRHFKGNNHIAMQQSMERSHKARGFNEIGQHLTLAPDGKWVTGRDFNRSPASIAGRNSLGFCIETWGDFDSGKDKLQGAQLDALYKFVAFMVEFHGLNPDKNITFHREYSDKSCPGTGVNKANFINDVKKYMEEAMIEKIKVTLDNKLIGEGVLIDGRSYLPVRDLSNPLKLDVKWNAATKTVELKTKK